MTDHDDRDLIALARTLRPIDAERHDVPGDLWSRIEAAVAESPTAAAPPVSPAAVVVSLHDRRRRRAIGLIGGIGVAAALVLAVFLVRGAGHSGRELAAAPLSNAGLASFPQEPTGTARLVIDHGREYVEVRVDHTPSAADHYLELWLIDRNVSGMVSLGPYHGNGRYAVPAGVDPTRFPVVDLSVEPTDGVPTHSGVSVVRGAFPEGIELS